MGKVEQTTLTELRRFCVVRKTMYGKVDKHGDLYKVWLTEGIPCTYTFLTQLFLRGTT